MDVLVIGAGVSGLTTAICLAEAGLSVTIRTAALPGQTTSVAAGAVWGLTRVGPPDRIVEWGRAGLEALSKLAAEPGTGVRMAAGKEISRAPLETHDWTGLVTGLRPCEKSELPDGFTAGWHYTAPLATMPVYLDYLRGRFERAGGTLEVAAVGSLGELAGAAPVIVNCSGAAAHDLVPDPAVVPVRGQVVIAANPGIEEFLIDRDPEPPWIVYMFPHGQTILLGGTNDEGNWDKDPKTEVAERIMAECSRYRTSPARGGDPRSPGRVAAVPTRGAAGIRAARRRHAVAQLRPRQRRHLAVLGLRRRDHRRHCALAVQLGGQASSFRVRIVHQGDYVTGPRDTLLLMKFAIAIPQFYADGEFDPGGVPGLLRPGRGTRLRQRLGAGSRCSGRAPQLGPIEAMTYAAACTERMRLGCVVFVSTLHSPVHLAKSLSTLDQLSRGRIEVGVGTGGKGAPVRRVRRGPGRYVARFTEGIALMKALWTEPRVTFHGEFWQLENAAMEPKPFQKPLPAAVVRRGQRTRAAAGRPAGRRLLRRGVLPHGEVRRAGPDRQGRARGGGPGRPRTSPSPSACTSRSTRTPSGREPDERGPGADIRAPGAEPSRPPRSPARRPTASARCTRWPTAGAELILFTTLFDQAEQMERLAAAVHARSSASPARRDVEADAGAGAGRDHRLQDVQHASDSPGPCQSGASRP